MLTTDTPRPLPPHRRQSPTAPRHLMPHSPLCFACGGTTSGKCPSRTTILRRQVKVLPRISSRARSSYRTMIIMVVMRMLMLIGPAQHAPRVTPSATLPTLSAHQAQGTAPSITDLHGNTTWPEHLTRGNVSNLTKVRHGNGFHPRKNYTMALCEAFCESMHPRPTHFLYFFSEFGLGCKACTTMCFFACPEQSDNRCIH